MTFLKELRLAVRGLSKTPGETLASVLVIALGAGVNLAVFAVAYGVLVRPLPYGAAGELAILSVSAGDGTDFGVPAGEVEAWREGLRSVSRLGAFSRDEVVLRGDGEARPAEVARVDRDFFATLGFEPGVLGSGAGAVRGRLEAFSEAPGLVLAESAAGRLFSGRALGSTVDAGGESLEVVAVVPPAFAFPAGLPQTRVDAWLPGLGEEQEQHCHVVARLARGVSFETLRAEAARLLLEIRGADFADERAGFVTVTPLEDALVGPLEPAILAAAGAALLVLLVTCGNVAMLRLGRAASRRRDAAVRLALGAGRLDLVRGALAETLLLALSGALLGLALARGVVSILAALVPDMPRLAEVSIGVPVGSTGLVLVLLVMLLAALLPLRRRADVAPLLRSGRGGSQRSGFALTALVILQIAASFVLLAGAALLTRTLSELAGQDFGVDSGADGGGVLVAELHRDHGGDADVQNLFASRLLERVRALPGVEAAGLGSALPPQSSPFSVYIRVILDGRDEGLPFSIVRVTPGYLEALGVRPESGRLLEAHDDETIVLSRSAADFLLPGVEASSRRLTRRLPPVVPWTEAPRVAGVVDEVKYLGLDQPPRAAIYVPWRARPEARSHLAVSTAGDPRALAPALRGLLRELDPELPRPVLASLDEVVASSVSGRRARVVTASGFAAVALLVALAGVLGLFLRLAAEARREMAIRLALGSTHGGVVLLMLRRAGWMVGLGVAGGLAGAAVTGRGLRHLLYGVGPLDPAALAAAAVLVAVSALLAAYLPARRLEKLAPSQVLRQD